jgi:anti-sigma-K factor RskA
MSHDEMHELLAGYVLRSLSGEDAAEADRILIEHVPGCEACRATLDAFQAVAGELALDAHPLAPPDTLRVRLGRELEPRTRLGGRWSSGRIVAVAASVVLVVGVGGLALTQRGGGGLVSGDGLARADIQDVTNAVVSPDATQHDLGQHHATEISSPDTEKIYVYGANVPFPPPGTVYRLWALTAGQPIYIGDFLPNDDGTVILEISSLDPSSIEQLTVTVEPAGSIPSTPGDPAWASTG